jgi:hypothetical protein
LVGFKFVSLLTPEVDLTHRSCVERSVADDGYLVSIRQRVKENVIKRLAAKPGRKRSPVAAEEYEALKR